jgi:hypothetical protein
MVVLNEMVVPDKTFVPDVLPVFNVNRGIKRDGDRKYFHDLHGYYALRSS